MVLPLLDIALNMPPDTFARGLYAFALLLSYAAAPMGVLAIIISVMKYQKDQFFNPDDVSETRKELFTTVFAAVVMILMPFLINIFYWIINGEMLGWGWDDLVNVVIT